MPVQVVGRYEKIWKPHAVQAEFVRLPFSFFEGFYGGAAGGGKSELLLMLPIVYGFHDIPGFQGIIFRKTFPQLEESLIPRSHSFYKPLQGRYNDSKHVWTFPSGATIRFSYMETDQDARDHDTAEYHYAGFDELTAFNAFKYLYITSRVRSSIPGVPAIVRSASNPGNVGHVWVRDRFVAPAPLGRKRIYDSVSETSRIFIPAKLTDNPHLVKNDPGYRKRLELLPEAERRAKIYGDWWVFAGQVFSEWRDRYAGTTFSDEPANANHVVEDFEPPLFWPRIIAADWGFAAKTWVGWGAVSPDQRLFLYREHAVTKTDIAIWGADVRRLSQYELNANAIRIAVLDPSAWARRGEEKTIAIQITEATGIRWEKADNDRIGGKLWMHEMLRWKNKPPSSEHLPPEGFDPQFFDWVLRNQGSAAAVEYYNLFQPEAPELNIPKLQVCKRCVEFRKVIPSCVYDDKEGEVIEDVKEFAGDDPYDGGRYLVKAFHRLTKEAKEKGQAVDQLGQIIHRLETTGDWNTYYRQMHRYEKSHSGPVPVYRGRRRGVHYVARG
jgi:hypothetical protein